MSKKEYEGVWYSDNPDYDYSTEIEKAASQGAYKTAARLEQERNAKIMDMGLDYETTYKYQDYLTESNRGADKIKVEGSGSGSGYALNNFSYNPATDPLYKQIKKSAEANAKRTAQDVLADQATMTGGVPSSYAATAAAGSANQVRQEADDMIPELWQLAYGVYADQKADAYQRQRDKILDERYQAELEASNEATKLKNEWAQKEWDEKQTQNAQDQVWKFISMGHMPEKDLIEKAGMDIEDVQALVNMVKPYEESKESNAGGNLYAVSTEYWQGDLNPDAKKYGTFNGYQPKGISGHGKLIKTDDIYLNDTVIQYGPYEGKKQTLAQAVWEAADGTRWYWEGRENEYKEIQE